MRARWWRDYEIECLVWLLREMESMRAANAILDAAYGLDAPPDAALCALPIPWMRAFDALWFHNMIHEGD